jgi:hypothetical protein
MRIYQLTNRDGEEWALIATTSNIYNVQKVWTEVMREEEDNEDVEDDPIDRFLDKMYEYCRNTERVYIEGYVRP